MLRWSARARNVVVLGAVLLAIAGLAATIRLYVYPVTNHITHADAVIVLGGPDEAARIDRGVALVRSGVAPILLVSFPAPEYCDVKPAGVRVVCFKPQPDTTQGEARAIGRQASAAGWQSLVVVTTRFQSTRARLRVRRCYAGRLAMATVSPRLVSWPYEIAYEWAATAKAVFIQRNC